MEWICPWFKCFYLHVQSLHSWLVLAVSEYKLKQSSLWCHQSLKGFWSGTTNIYKTVILFVSDTKIGVLHLRAQIVREDRLVTQSHVKAFHHPHASPPSSLLLPCISCSPLLSQPHRLRSFAFSISSFPHPSSPSVRSLLPGALPIPYVVSHQTV